MADIHDLCKAITDSVSALSQAAHVMPIGTYLDDKDIVRLKAEMYELNMIIQRRARPRNG